MFNARMNVDRGQVEFNSHISALDIQAVYEAAMNILLRYLKLLINL